MDKIEWDTPLLTLVAQLRRLQYAANSLNIIEFCEALGWPLDDYSKHKFEEFQAFGRMGRFDDRTLEAPVKFYEAREERYAAERKAREESLVRSGHIKQGTLPGGTPESNPSAVYATERGEARHTKGGPARD